MWLKQLKHFQNVQSQMSLELGAHFHEVPHFYKTVYNSRSNIELNFLIS